VPDLESRLAARARGKQPSPIRELLKYLKIEGMISLGGGYPNPKTFVFDSVDIRFKDGTEATLAGRELDVASQYGPSDAHAGLRDEIVAWHKDKDGVELDGSRLVVLNGCQEGLFIMAYLFVEADDSIALSEPAYPGALSAFKSFTKNYVAVPLDGDGMKTDVLEATLAGMSERGEALPKFIYTVPSGHNPGGVALSQERKRHMLEIASRFDLVILEDDPYQLIRLDDSPPPPTIQSMDTEDRVIRLDSFSKIFTPGLRIGYASGPAEMVRQFVLFKQSANLHTSMFIQAVLEKYMSVAGHDAFRAHIRENCAFYRENRDAMVEAVREFLPEEVGYNIPSEGMFIWFDLPECCDARRMIDERCEELKVLLTPGSAFSTRGGLANSMRASFSMISPAEVREGIRRFGEMVAAELGRAG